MAKRSSRIGYITICVLVAVLLAACVILIVEDMWGVPVEGPAKSSQISSLISEASNHAHA